MSPGAVIVSRARKRRVFVLGWYDHGNAGDESFRQGFHTLWPDCDFDFGGAVPADVNERFDAVMIGGGSFLDQFVARIDTITVPLAFIGIGVGGSIHPAWQPALARARAIVTRDSRSHDALPEAVQVNAMIGADLFYARDLSHLPLWTPEDNSRPIVTFMLSEHFVPRGKDAPEWKVTPWHWFKRETAQVCDDLIEQKYSVRFQPLCVSRSFDDRRPSSSVISRMVHAERAFCYYGQQLNEPDLFAAMAKSTVIVTQRLHGAIFASALGIPFVMIAGHDKMWTMMDEMGHQNVLDYYAVNARKIRKAIAKAEADGPGRTRIYAEKAGERWRVLSATVAERLSL